MCSEHFGIFLAFWVTGDIVVSENNSKIKAISRKSFVEVSLYNVDCILHRLSISDHGLITELEAKEITKKYMHKF